MKNNFTFSLLLCLFLFLAGCSTFAKQEGLPSMVQIDKWVEQNQYGLALTSLEHISSTEKLFADYVSKRKMVIVAAANYEHTILKRAQIDIDKDSWTDAILSLSVALNNYPNSRLIHDRYNVVIKKQQKRIHKFDAKSLLARAQLLYNKLPISQKDVSNSPINFAAQWDLQSLKNELSDMHARLMAMTEQLIDDNEISLAESCLTQATILTKDTAALATIKTLQTKIDLYKEVLHVAAEKQLAIIEKRKAEKKTRSTLSKKRKHSRKISRLIKKINFSLNNEKLINAKKQLSILSRLTPNSTAYLQLQLKHRDKVNKRVYKLTEQGNSFYRQEKIAAAKKIWQAALNLDTKNKTLQVQIRRATKVLIKLKELRKRSTAVRQ